MPVTLAQAKDALRKRLVSRFGGLLDHMDDSDLEFLARGVVDVLGLTINTRTGEIEDPAAGARVVPRDQHWAGAKRRR